MELKGIIKILNATTQVTDSFKNRKLVLTTEEQYPQHLEIEFTQSKVDDLNSFAEGQKVKIQINLKGREWTNPMGEVKYFNSIQGWKIEPM